MVFIIFGMFFILLMEINSQVGDQFLGMYILLSTMALGLTVVYIIYVTAKLSGFLDKIRSTKDPRRDITTTISLLSIIFSICNLNINEETFHR